MPEESALLDGKVAIVTGAQRGIGKAIALTFAGHGAKVVVNDLNADGIHDVTKEIEDFGGEAVAAAGDIGTSAGAKHLVDTAVSAFGQLDIQVNNAGVLRRGELLEIPEADWDEHFRVNVKGPLFCCQQAVPAMKNGGRIINIASTATRIPRFSLAAYSASKAALAQLTRVMALEFASKGVTVNAVAPGPTETEMALGSFLGGDLSKLNNVIKGNLEEFRLGIPLGRLLKPQEIANAVLFMASPWASAITGQVLYVDGGQEML